jgi:hypothetical protein
MKRQHKTFGLAENYIRFEELNWDGTDNKNSFRGSEYISTNVKQPNGVCKSCGQKFAKLYKDEQYCKSKCERDSSQAS